jgi:DNA repair exonuclease SbcCD ATPase subunit
MATEGSVTFSLRELARLEQERVDDARAAAPRHRELAAEARARAERRASDERLAKERQEAEARREQAQREREEQARLDAIERAIVERALKEAQERAAAEERERQHERDLRLASARRDHHGRRLARWVAFQTAAFLVVLAAGTVAYAGFLAPSADRALSAAKASVAERDEEIVGLRRQIAALEARATRDRADLDQEIQNSAALTLALDKAHQDLDALRRQRGGRGVGIAEPPKVVGLNTHCDPTLGDPLCGNLGR